MPTRNQENIPVAMNPRETQAAQIWDSNRRCRSRGAGDTTPSKHKRSLVPPCCFPFVTPNQLPDLFAFPIVKEGAAYCSFRSRTSVLFSRGGSCAPAPVGGVTEEVGSLVGLASLWLWMLLWAELHPCKIQSSPQDLGTRLHVETEEKKGVRPQ